MSYSVVETASALPALAIFVPTATAVLIFIFGRMVSWLRETLALISA